MMRDEEESDRSIFCDCVDDDIGGSGGGVSPIVVESNYTFIELKLHL